MGKTIRKSKKGRIEFVANGANKRKFGYKKEHKCTCEWCQSGKQYKHEKAKAQIDEYSVDVSNDN